LAGTNARSAGLANLSSDSEDAMSIFGKIWDRITVSAEERREHQQKRQGGAPKARAPAAPAAQARPAPVDVEAILERKAAAKGGGGNWRTSIVDLLNLLDLESSLDARKELAAELNVNAGAHGSAEQNIALSRAVWRKLAENGGRVPETLRA
jgi:Domain of unknown function (DUF3597)